MSELISMDYYILFGTSAFINAAAAFLIGMYVLLRNYRNKIYYIFALMNFAVGLFSTAYGFWQFSNNTSSAIFWIRILILGSTFIPVLYLHFIVLLIKKYPRYAYFVKLVYIVTFLFALLSFTPYYFTGVEEKLSFPYWPNGSLLYFFNILFIYIGIFVFAFFIQYRHYNELDSLRKKQIRWVMVGSILAVVGGSSNFPLWFEIPIFPYGNLFVFIYVLFFAYAITRYSLLDIRIILRKGIIYSLTVILALTCFVLLVYGIRGTLIDSLHVNETTLYFASSIAVILIVQPLQFFVQRIVDRIIFNERFDLFHKMNSDDFLVMKSKALRAFSQNVIIHATQTFSTKGCEFLIWDEEERQYLQYYKSSRYIVLQSNDPILLILERFKRHIYTEDIEKFAGPEGIENEVIKSCVRRLKQLDVQLLMPLVIHDRILAIVLVGRFEKPEMTDREISLLSMEFCQKLSYTLMVNYQFKPLQE